MCCLFVQFYNPIFRHFIYQFGCCWDLFSLHLCHFFHMHSKCTHNNVKVVYIWEQLIKLLKAHLLHWVRSHVYKEYKRKHHRCTAGAKWRSKFKPFLKTTVVGNVWLEATWVVEVRTLETKHNIRNATFILLINSCTTIFGVLPLFLSNAVGTQSSKREKRSRACWQ